MKNFLKTTFRNIWKNKAYSLLNIGVLAIGIACAGLIFLWIGDEMTFDHVNIKKDRLYSLEVNLQDNGNIYTMESTPRIMARTIKAEIPGITDVCRIGYGDNKLLFTIGDKALYATGKFADPSVLSMFTIPFVQGDPKTAFVQPYSIVITEQTTKSFLATNKM